MPHHLQEVPGVELIVPVAGNGLEVAAAREAELREQDRQGLPGRGGSAGGGSHVKLPNSLFVNVLMLR